jgi:hypothetical protein
MKSTCNTEQALPTFMIHPKTNSYESRFQLSSWWIKLNSTPAGTGYYTGFSYSITFPSIDIRIEIQMLF